MDTSPAEGASIFEATPCEGGRERSRTSAFAAQAGGHDPQLAGLSNSVGSPLTIPIPVTVPTSTSCTRQTSA
jgi:hypothetical protein